MWQTVGMSCGECADLSERRHFSESREYRAIARRLMEIVGQGRFVLLKASCPLRELFGPVWPGDLLEHIFRCAKCGDEFRLFADTWHGSVEWGPIRDEDAELA